MYQDCVLFCLIARCGSRRTWALISAVTWTRMRVSRDASMKTRKTFGVQIRDTRRRMRDLQASPPRCWYPNTRPQCRISRMWAGSVPRSAYGRYGRGIRLGCSIRYLSTAHRVLGGSRITNALAEYCILHSRFIGTYSSSVLGTALARHRQIDRRTRSLYLVDGRESDLVAPYLISVPHQRCTIAQKGDSWYRVCQYRTLAMQHIARYQTLAMQCIGRYGTLAMQCIGR